MYRKLLPVDVNENFDFYVEIRKFATYGEEFFASERPLAILVGLPVVDKLQKLKYSIRTMEGGKYGQIFPSPPRNSSTC